MENLTINEINNAVNGKVINFFNNSIIDNIVIDSRKANNNSLYIPIIGEIHDGHIFLEDAYNNGCRNFIIDENHSFLKNDSNIIQIKDTTIFLGNISKYYKEKFNIPFIAVTGSVGKTSTKDMIYSVLNKKYKTLKNIGNLNSNIGLPRTLFNLDNSYETAVVEMGLSYKGDIEYLANLVNPNIAVISNIGLSHIENFNNQDEIFDSKMEITSNFSKDSLLIVNGDDEYLMTLKNKKLNYKLLSYGFNNDNDIYCNNYAINESNIEFTCVINNQEETFIIPTIAKHNILNAMAAILVGLNLNMNIEDIKEGLKTFAITKGRLTIINKRNITIIDDSYNASADSMISALSVLSSYKTRRVAILGDVLETGSYERQIHEKIGSNIINNVDLLITVGNSSKYIDLKAMEEGFSKENILHFYNYEEVINNIDNIIKENDTILVKASHGIELDKVVEYLEQKYE